MQWLADYAQSKLTDDLRSAVVGTIIGSFLGLLTVALAATSKIEHFVKTNDKGFAQPFPLMASQLAKEDEPITLTFLPPDFIDLYVCESAYVSAPDHRGVLLDYVNRYSMCMDITAESKTKFVIRPNRLSQAVFQVDDEWICKCPDVRR